MQARPRAVLFVERASSIAARLRRFAALGVMVGLDVGTSIDSRVAGAVVLALAEAARLTATLAYAIDPQKLSMCLRVASLHAVAAGKPLVGSGSMGMTYATGTLRRPSRLGKARPVRFLVDTGAVYTVLPERIWKSLGLEAEREVEFTLADGTTITRGVGECRFELAGRAATSPVVLGEPDDGPLLGAVTLETLGLMVNPLTRRLIQMRHILARAS